MKYGMQKTENLIVVMQILSKECAQQIAAGYYEQCAIGYNTHSDQLELVILSCGSGAGDDRVLADRDESEMIHTDVLMLAAAEIRKIAHGHKHEHDLIALADYVDEQSEFLFEYRNN